MLMIGIKLSANLSHGNFCINHVCKNHFLHILRVALKWLKPNMRFVWHIKTILHLCQRERPRILWNEFFWGHSKEKVPFPRGLVAFNLTPIIEKQQLCDEEILWKYPTHHYECLKLFGKRLSRVCWWSDWEDIGGNKSK